MKQQKKWNKNKKRKLATRTLKIAIYYDHKIALNLSGIYLCKKI